MNKIKRVLCPGPFTLGIINLKVYVWWNPAKLSSPSLVTSLLHTMEVDFCIPNRLDWAQICSNNFGIRVTPIFALSFSTLSLWGR